MVGHEADQRSTCLPSVHGGYVQAGIGTRRVSVDLNWKGTPQ
jgi:hypothetical protein